jgi:arylsulfatase A-like enzyme
METHLPYSPPESYIRRFVPYYREERAARSFMRRFNTEALRWLIPMEEPFSELEARTLSDMYDAEVAYQDHLLAQIFDALDHPLHRENTMVIFVADHGEMLGEHRLMGHGFGAYQELVHVPMIVRYPGQTDGRQVSEPVSITRLYHTILDLAGLAHVEDETRPYLEIEKNSFLRNDLAIDVVPPVAEAYAPSNAILMMEKNIPLVIDELNSRATNRAIYDGRSKLYQVEDLEWRLYDLDHDPKELHGLLLGEEDSRITDLAGRLKQFVEQAVAQRSGTGQQRSTHMDDERIMQRLRDLGYVD